MALPDPPNLREIDARGLRCPMPVLRAARALREIPPGACLRVLCDDPAAPAEFAAFCESAGATLLESLECGGGFTILIRRA